MPYFNNDTSNLWRRWIFIHEYLCFKRSYEHNMACSTRRLRDIRASSGKKRPRVTNYRGLFIRSYIRLIARSREVINI